MTFKMPVGLNLTKKKCLVCVTLENKGSCRATSWNIVCESLRLLSLLLPFSWPQEVNFFPEPFTGGEIKTTCVCHRAVSGLRTRVIWISYCLPERPTGENNEGVQKRNILPARSGRLTRPSLICWGRLLTGSPGKNDWKLGKKGPPANYLREREREMEKKREKEQ